jgi:flavin-dependent dehydrogenase
MRHLPGRTLAVAFASDPEVVRDFGLALAPNWLKRLRRTQHVAARVKRFRLQSARLAVRVAPTTRLDGVNAAHWLAVGDAAAACDPISSQGIVNALEDGLRASETIADAATSSETIN